MLDDLDNVFDDHPSLDASLEDFENNSDARRSPLFGLPSQHSGFRADDSDDGEAEDSTPAPCADRWSPPGFRRYDRHVRKSGWYRHQPYAHGREDSKLLDLKPTVGVVVGSATQSREPSPQYEDAIEEAAPPAPAMADAYSRTQQAQDLESMAVAAAKIPLPADTDSPVKGRTPSPAPAAQGSRREHHQPNRADGLEFGPENLSNCRRASHPLL